MKTFKTIYPFEALDKIAAGEDVGVLDRLTGKGYKAKDVTTEFFAKAVNSKEKNRFDFWVIEEEEETEENKE